MKPVLSSLPVLVLLALVALLLPGRAEGEPLRVFIRAGKKTHGPGAHDHPRFLEDWTKLLRERGATVDGALGFPTAGQLAACDVMVTYAANAGNIDEDQRKLLAAFQKRGGGLVFIHDGVCSDHHDWFKTVTGGAWEHGRSRWFEGPVDVDYTTENHPITEGAKGFGLEDEIYWDLHLMPESKVLAGTTCQQAPGSPQMWAYTAGTSRVFSSIPGHWYATFSVPQYRAILLRGIAWAGNHPVDSLTTAEEREALRNPRDAMNLKETSQPEAGSSSGKDRKRVP